MAGAWRTLLLALCGCGLWLQAEASQPWSEAQWLTPQGHKFNLKAWKGQPFVMVFFDPKSPNNGALMLHMRQKFALGERVVAVAFAQASAAEAYARDTGTLMPLVLAVAEDVGRLAAAGNRWGFTPFFVRINEQERIVQSGFSVPEP